MYAGRVVEQGPADQVFDRAAAPVHRGAVGGRSRTIGDPAARFAPPACRGTRPARGDLPPGCPFHPRCPRAVDACRRPSRRCDRGAAGRHGRLRHGWRGGERAPDDAPILEARGLARRVPAARRQRRRARSTAST